MQRESEEMREREVGRRKVKKNLERERKRELFQWPSNLDKRKRKAQFGVGVGSRRWWWWWY